MQARHASPTPQDADTPHRPVYCSPFVEASRSNCKAIEAEMVLIRWEMLREGVEDYEYLCMLRRLLAGPSNLSSNHMNIWVQTVCGQV